MGSTIKSLIRQLITEHSRHPRGTCGSPAATPPLKTLTYPLTRVSNWAWVPLDARGSRQSLRDKKKESQMCTSDRGRGMQQRCGDLELGLEGLFRVETWIHLGKPHKHLKERSLTNERAANVIYSPPGLPGLGVPLRTYPVKSDIQG